MVGWVAGWKSANGVSGYSLHQAVCRVADQPRNTARHYGLVFNGCSLLIRAGLISHPNTNR